MRFLISLAWKNLLRHGRRTLITAGAIAVGLGLYVFLDGWIQGTDDQSQTNMAWYETAGARIVDDEYWDDRDGAPLDHAVDDPEAIVALVEELGYQATPRTSFAGELIVTYDPFPEDGSLPTRIIALDPETDPDVYRINRTIVDGAFLEPGQEGVLMGAWTAEDIGAELGYTVTIATRTVDGYRQTIRLPIVGIFSSPNPVMNRGTLFVDLEVADFYLEMNGAVTQVDVALPERADRERAGRVLSRELELPAGLEVITWDTLASEVLAVAEADMVGTAIILFLVFIIAAVGVGNTMLMAVFERIRELGMMRAIGMTDRQVRMVFVMEAAGVGFIGSVGGLLIGALGNLYMVNVGIDFGFFTESIGNVGYRIVSVSYGTWNPTTMIIAFFVGVVMSAAISWLPARKASQMTITESLIHQ